MLYSISNREDKRYRGWDYFGVGKHYENGSHKHIGTTNDWEFILSNG